MIHRAIHPYYYRLGSYQFNDTTQWESKPFYFLNKAEQGTDAWKNARKWRVTASNASTCVGHNPYKSREQFGKELCGLSEPYFSAYSLRVMKIGTDNEPIARTWYSNQFNVVVKELGLAVSKEDPRIGASVDGLVFKENEEGDLEQENLIIEIKCPLRMYKELLHHQSLLHQGLSFPEHYHDHIKINHYDQMQCSMYILKVKYCDYCVFSIQDEMTYVERIPFNEAYWKEELHPQIGYFLEEVLDPHVSTLFQ